MYTKRKYPTKDMFNWTKRDVLKFIVVSGVPVSLYTLFHLKFLTLPWLPIALIGTALAFIVSFKNNISYDRLWEARKIWGGIVNTSRSWTVLVQDLIDVNDTMDEVELKRIQKGLIDRHIAWMTAHRYALRAPKPWELFLSNKSNKAYSKFHPTPESEMTFEDAVKKYLTNEELESLASVNNKSGYVLSMQSKVLKELKKKGAVQEYTHIQFQKLIVEMYTLQGKNELIKNFPYPRQFATLNYLFVRIFILLLPFGLMGAFDETGRKLLEGASKLESSTFQNVSYLIADNFVWLTVPFCVIISWVFQTMERVGEVSENPFEGTANDVPITTMARAIEIDMLQLMNTPKEQIPNPIASKNHIQM